MAAGRDRRQSRTRRQPGADTVITLAQSGLVLRHEGTAGWAVGAWQAVTADDRDPRRSGRRRGLCSILESWGFLDAREALHVVMAAVSRSVSFAAGQPCPPAASRAQILQVVTDVGRDRQGPADLGSVVGAAPASSDLASCATPDRATAPEAPGRRWRRCRAPVSVPAASELACRR